MKKRMDHCVGNGNSGSLRARTALVLDDSGTASKANQTSQPESVNSNFKQTIEQNPGRP